MAARGGVDRTSHAVELPLRRSHRVRACAGCGRCPIGSSAWSAWTMAHSPARSSPTATTSWPGTHSSANVTCAARTGNCCSTRSWRPPTRWSSRTPAPTSARTNPEPPCVPLGELLDTLETMAPGARDHVLVHHPLQPFDPRNFEPGALGSASRSATTSGHSRRLVDPASLARPPPPRCWTTCRRSTSRNCLRRTSARSWPPLSTRSCALVWDCRCARTTIRLRSRFQSH